jgi:hypothetical protein
METSHVILTIGILDDIGASVGYLKAIVSRETTLSHTCVAVFLDAVALTARVLIFPSTTQILHHSYSTSHYAPYNTSHHFSHNIHNYGTANTLSTHTITIIPQLKESPPLSVD